MSNVENFGREPRSFLEEDYRRTVTGEVRSRFLPGTAVEIIREVGPGHPDSGTSCSISTAR